MGMPGFGDYGHVPLCPGHPDYIDPNEAFMQEARESLWVKYMTSGMHVSEAFCDMPDADHAAIVLAVMKAVKKAMYDEPTHDGLQAIGQAVWDAVSGRAERDTADGIYAEATRLRLAHLRDMAD